MLARDRALLALAAAALLAFPSAALGDAWHQRGSPLKPRQQWMANYGYCGETSFIAAGLSFGQYTSQWTARRLASPGVKQTKAASQLLIGSNDLRAAKRMRLRAAEFDNSAQASPEQFLAWTKRRFLAGNAVIMGVFNNVTMLGEPLSLADDTYDHIVAVEGIGSSVPFPESRAYQPTDQLTISDNGLYTIGRNTPFLYSYRFDQFPASRAVASEPQGPLYSLDSTPPNYGVAIAGVADPEGVTVPVRLRSSADGEGTINRARLTRPPDPFPIALRATVELPAHHRAYNLYLYDSFDTVPKRDFNARAKNARRVWRIPAGHERRFQVRIRTNSAATRVFRAVPARAD